MPLSRLERGTLGGLTALAAGVAAVRNLRGVVDFDEDETRYFELAESLGRHVHALDGEQMFLHLVGTYRPPLLVVADTAALLLMPPSPHLLSVVRVAWVALLLWAAAGLARDLYGGAEHERARAGALAMVLVGTAPIVALLGGSLMSEVPLAALFACALRGLLALEREGRDRVAAGLGVVVGAAMLVKWTLPVSLAAPALVAVLVSTDRAGMARRGALAIGVAAAVAGPWYLLAGGRVATFIFSVGAGAGAGAFGATERSTLADWLYYPGVLASELLWLPVALGAAVAAAVAVRDQPRRTAVILAGVLGPALLFSLLDNKEARYLLPSLPAWGALAAAGAVGWLPDRRRLVPGVTVVGLLGLLWAAARHDDSAFQYRRAVPSDLPIAAIDDVVQGANPGGPRRAAVMSPEAWLWTPLWARGASERGRTRWQAAWCAPHLMDEAAFFLVASPQGTMQHCAADGATSLAKLAELRSELELVSTWTGGGKRLDLYVHPRRLTQR